MKKDATKGKHSHNNRESKEGQVLRFIREVRKYSLIDVADKLGMKSAEVDHFENGRKFYSSTDIEKFLECYDVKKSNFDYLMTKKTINRQTVNHFLSNL